LVWSCKAAGQSRYYVAVPPAHGFLKALDIRVAIKRCAVERRGCHLSDQEDTSLEGATGSRQIRSPRHERIRRGRDGHSAARRTICPVGYCAPAELDMEWNPGRYRRSRPA